MTSGARAVTAPLLHKLENMTDTSLSLYIDDGAIFACGRKWLNVKQTMRECYSTCVEWLMRAGLSVEPEKTELLFFKKWKDKPASPNYIHLPLPLQNTYYRVQASNTLRYLSFFLDTGLMWKHHVEVMCNRT